MAPDPASHARISRRSVIPQLRRLLRRQVLLERLAREASLPQGVASLKEQYLAEVTQSASRSRGA